MNRAAASSSIEPFPVPGPEISGVTTLSVPSKAMSIFTSPEADSKSKR